MSRAASLLDSLLDRFPAGESSPYVDIPLLVFGGVTGREDAALPLADLGKYLFLGLDIIDDITDGDAAAHWPDHHRWELQLGSSLFLSALPQALIANLQASESIRTEIQRRFANGLLEIAAGQQKELEMTGKPAVDPQEVEDSVCKKSSGVATLASIAALFAGGTKDEINAYEEMGRNLGSAAQLATDFPDPFQAPISRDLRNGTRTLPIALYLEKCTEAEREILSGPLAKARTLLYSKGIARLTAFIIELYCERARKSLVSANPKKPYRERMISYINGVSLFKKEGDNHELRTGRETDRQVG